MMSEPKTEPIPAPDPATPTVAAPDQNLSFNSSFKKLNKSISEYEASESRSLMVENFLTSSDELGCRVDVRLGCGGGEEAGGL